MHLVHQRGAVKVGEVVRYTLTYTPSEDRILPSPPALYVKFRNDAAIPLRAAYLHGPYNIYVSAYPATFSPNVKNEDQRRYGAPQFEPYLKPGGEWTAKLLIPEEMRETVEGFARGTDSVDGQRSVTWIIEISSQILFSMSASISYELLVSRDEKSLDMGWAAVAGRVRGEPGQVADHQQVRRGGDGHSAATKGVHSKAIKLVVEDTASLWNKPALPEWDERPKSSRRSSLKRRISQRTGRTQSDAMKSGSESGKNQTKIHLVVLTHGLHSNLGADMLYLKESIDAAVKNAKENKKRRKQSEASSQVRDDQAAGTRDPIDAASNGGHDSSTPRTGGNDQPDANSDDDDDEEVIVRGFGGNATKTEKGIQYLGKRMAKNILELTYPDQPFFPVKKSMSGKLTNALSTSSKDSQEGAATHNHSTIHKAEEDVLRAYKFTSISFVGHSLGGLVQLYAIAYIQKHSPNFFNIIEPVNFIALATPFLGLSNENPVYVKFALDFGLVGRTGQDLGLTWRPPTIARSGWSAMVGGLGSGGQRETHQEDPGSKPLLRILPTGPAHQVLKRFRNRTVYSNVVNDGIVPLRTSCLLFLDWRGLGRVDKARRDNGLIGTVANWGWAEMTGQNSSPHPTSGFSGDESDGIGSPQHAGAFHDSEVPQPADDMTNIDDETQGAAQTRSQGSQSLEGRDDMNERAVSPGPIDTFLNFFRPSATSPRAQKSRIKPLSKKDSKMLKRSQTLKAEDWDHSGGEASVTWKQSHDHRIPTREEGEHGQQAGSLRRPQATRGDSIREDPSNMLAPPKTSIFESAGDLLAPPIPSSAWINDPSTRTRTIFHDRIYHPGDIPPPPMKRPGRPGRTMSSGSLGDSSRRSIKSTNSSTTSDQTLGQGFPADSSAMRVEEKIARAYHRDLSWRKVLVRLEPDAHNNIVVRRMFANAYGWPVINHLCDTHFGDTWAAKTRDELLPASDRAHAENEPINDFGEHVKGQEDRDCPAKDECEMREQTDELKPLRNSRESKTRISREDSASWNERYFQSDDDDDDGNEDGKNAFQRLLSPPPKRRQPVSVAGPSEPPKGNKYANPSVAANFTEEPDSLEALTRSQNEGPPKTTPNDLIITETSPSPTEVGLRKPLEEMVSPPGSPSNKRPASSGGVASGSVGGVSERVARLSMAGESSHSGL